jgi:hypothetical protein
LLSPHVASEFRRKQVIPLITDRMKDLFDGDDRGSQYRARTSARVPGLLLL